MLSDPGSIVLSTLSGYVSSMLHIGDQLKQQRLSYHVKLKILTLKIWSKHMPQSVLVHY